MSFTASYNSNQVGIEKRLPEYERLRDEYAEFGSVRVKQKTDLMSVYALLLNMGHEKVTSYEKLGVLYTDLISLWLSEFKERQQYKTMKDLISLIIQIESKVGRSVRKFREDGAMLFNAKTYHTGSKAHQVNTNDHGDTAIEVGA